MVGTSLVFPFLPYKIQGASVPKLEELELVELASIHSMVQGPSANAFGEHEWDLLVLLVEESCFL